MSIPPQIGEPPSPEGDSSHTKQTAMPGPRTGWNSGHNHNTRLKARLQASLGTLASQHQYQEEVLLKNPFKINF